MTEDHDIDKQDKELEQYLDGDTPPSRAYAELGEEMPPPELDAGILAAAEREVKVTGINAQRAPPFKAFAWAAIVVLSFSLVLNIIFDESVRDPIAELDGILKEERPSDAFDVILEEAQSPAELDNRQVKENLMQAQQAETKLRRDQPAIAADQDHKEIVVTTRKRESSEDVRRMREMRDAPQERRAAARTAPVALPATIRQSPRDAFAREQIVQVLEDYSVRLSPQSMSAKAKAMESIDDSVAELSADSTVADDPETEMREILEAFRARRDDEAFELLEAFRETWPDHPVATTLTERGL